MQPIPKFVGIDVSKLTLDICIINGTSKTHSVISNDLEAIKTFFVNVQTESNGPLYIGMENTGCYNFYIYQAFDELDLPYYVISPLHLNKSLGLSRGKSDKVDAARIAYFVERNLKQLAVYKPQRQVVKQLQLLLCLREQRVSMKKQLLMASEPYQYLPAIACTQFTQLNNELISQIEAQIKAIESEINLLISQDQHLNCCFKLITTVQGVGKVLGWNLLVRTGEFYNISDPRKLACYAGVAPFEHSSGTSIRGKQRVSQFADKTLKKLLHMAAMSAIRLEGDLRDYYQRKVAQGKNKMSTLNAVRNKIIHRVYAVLRNQQPYQIYLPQKLLMS